MNCKQKNHTKILNLEIKIFEKFWMHHRKVTVFGGNIYPAMYFLKARICDFLSISYKKENGGAWDKVFFHSVTGAYIKKVITKNHRSFRDYFKAKYKYCFTVEPLQSHLKIQKWSISSRLRSLNGSTLFQIYSLTLQRGRGHS